MALKVTADTQAELQDFHARINFSQEVADALIKSGLAGPYLRGTDRENMLHCIEIAGQEQASNIGRLLQLREQVRTRQEHIANLNREIASLTERRNIALELAANPNPKIEWNRKWYLLTGETWRA